MILTVTPNPAIDVTYRCPSFQLDRVNRPQETAVYAGGKGINVARVLHRLGVPTLCTGLLAGRTGDDIEASLLEEGIPFDFLRIPGESRRCIAVVDPETGQQTEINEWGPVCGQDHIERLAELLHKQIASLNPEYVVLSGSLPPEAPSSTYAQLIALCNSAQVRTILDTSGPALAEGVKARPWMIKPNHHELEALCGVRADTLKTAGIAALNQKHTVKYGVAVTMGAEGAVLAADSVELLAIPPPVGLVSTVGSGDSFVAGYLYAHRNICPPAECLQWACGCGAANAEVYGSGFIDPSRAEELARTTIVRSLNGEG
jgi:tagatose 6-phosphate kinase